MNAPLSAATARGDDPDARPALLARDPHPGDAAIDAALAGQILPVRHIPADPPRVHRAAQLGRRYTAPVSEDTELAGSDTGFAAPEEGCAGRAMARTPTGGHRRSPDRRSTGRSAVGHDRSGRP